MDNSEIKICTFNVNGLRDNQKRKDVLTFLREHQSKCDLFFLQETHILATEEKILRSCWGFDVITAGNTTNSNGVAILFTNKFEYKILDTIRDCDGRYIIIDIEMSKKHLTLANIYGPSAGDNPEFFGKVSRVLEDVGNQHIIMAGDWNCALDTKIDVRNYTGFANRPRTRKKIHDIMAKLDLIDIWRQQNSEKHQYTWRRFNTTKQSRLDYFLMSEDLTTEVNSCKIEVGYRSDHSLVTLALKKEVAKRDRPFWKFNNALLKNPEYIETIKKLISEIKKQYAALVYNSENITVIPNEEICFTIHDQLFFETLLMEIRGKTISFATHVKRQENLREKEIERELKKREIENVIAEDKIEETELLKTELEEIRQKRIEGISIRSRSRWMLEGERVSKYFCNLENRNFKSKAIPFLEKDNGNLLTDQKDVLEEITSFYSNLYKKREVEEVDLNLLLPPDTPKLDNDERESIEGMITLDEAKYALKNMKNDKSPGPDGFTVEFFKFFFQDIGAFLVRSINYGFSIEGLSVTQRQGVITCIPKDNKPKQFIKNWRPISLLNTAYKIASSCISNRLKTVLPSIISEHQKGFLKGRNISDNIRMLYDVLLYCDVEKIPGMLVLLDFEKAFDSISWSFLKKALDFFNFGPDLQQWVRTFYNNPTTCIYVNGQYSEWFSIFRGVRQGDPSSPYLYLIGAEVLSVMLRCNLQIRGINIRDTLECMLSMFADDTSLCLDGSEQAFKESIHTVDKFSKMSGLQINVDKTQVIWLGSKKNSNSRYMRDRNFCWDPGTFKVLGVKLSTNIQSISEINYEGKLMEINRILTKWKKRNLTPFGKIAILKSLIISKLQYLFLNIPDPSEILLKELDSMFFQFLWNEKRSKIKKTVVCKPYEEGGLKMVNVYSFLATMKLSWLRRLKHNPSVIDLVTKFCPPLLNLDRFGSEYVHVILRDCGNKFWVDVLKHYKKLYSCCSPVNIHEFMAEPIFYNINILRGNNVVYIKQWVDAGILQVKHLVSTEGEWLTFQQFTQKFTNIRNANFLLYEGVLNAIKTYQRKLDLILTRHYRLHDAKCWLTITKGNKFTTNILNDVGSKPSCVSKWNTLFENLEWKTIFSMIFQTTVDTQFRWFQMRILHRIIATNKYLYMCNIIPNPRCSFCDQEDESIQHLFWGCFQTQSFWENLENFIKEKCDHCRLFSFSEELVIFGIQERIVTDRVMDFIILLAKLYIYRTRMEQKLPRILVFINMLKHRYRFEKYAATILGKSVQFETSWQLYLPLLNAVE